MVVNYTGAIVEIAEKKTGNRSPATHLAIRPLSTFLENDSIFVAN